MQKFLIIQTAFIGDVILATPLISELKRIYPTSEIDFLLRKGNQTLLENNPDLHEVFILDKKENKLKSILTLSQKFRKNKYDEIINLHRFASTGLITFLSKPKASVGFNKNPFSFFYSRKIKHQIGNGKHEVERNLECIKHHGATSKLQPKLYPSQEDLAFIHQFQNEATYFCLAPASVWFTKKLPEEKWLELAQKLIKNGKVYFIGGPNDFDLCEKLTLKINSENCQNIAGKLSFLQSAALFSKAEMNYVNDSGPLHFCSAVNAPVTAFFCSTTPEFGFGPLSEKSIVIETQELLSCKPCGLHGFKSCPQQHFLCGKGINIDLVK